MDMSNLPWDIKIWFYLSFVTIMIFFIDFLKDLKKQELAKIEWNKKDLHRKTMIYFSMAFTTTMLFFTRLTSFNFIVMLFISILVGLISSFIYLKFLSWVGKNDT